MNIIIAKKTRNAPIKYAVLFPSKKYILDAARGPIVLANEPADRNNPRISPCSYSFADKETSALIEGDVRPIDKAIKARAIKNKMRFVENDNRTKAITPEANPKEDSLDSPSIGLNFRTKSPWVTTNSNPIYTNINPFCIVEKKKRSTARKVSVNSIPLKAVI